jgi:hypothetical protein
VSRLLTGATLCAELAGLCGLLAPLAGARLSAGLRRGITTIWEGYTGGLAISLRAHLQVRRVRVGGWVFVHGGGG